MKNVTTLLALIASVLTNAALAATDPFSELLNESQDPPERISGDTVFIRPGSVYYSESVAATGAQGTVILLLDLSKDGHVTSARVHTSSHSDVLDAAAIRKALTMSYEGRGTPPAAVSLKVAFRRDDPYTLSDTSCKDFNVDVAWFRKTFPGRPETDMPAITVLGKMVQLNYSSADRWRRESILNAVPFAQCAVFPGCATSPDETLGKIFNRAMQDHVTNPKDDKELCAFARPSEPDDQALPRSLLRVDLDEPIHTRTQHITPDMPVYPMQLVSAGIQGQVMLEVTLTKQGKISDIRATHNQYKVAALADAAATHARSLPWSPMARANAPETIVILPVEFDKDTRASIGNKTCADFNIDLAAYRSRLPKAPLGTMNVVSVADAAFREHRYDGMADKGEWTTPRPTSPKDLETTVELCANQPQAKFIEVLRQQVLSTGQ